MQAGYPEPYILARTWKWFDAHVQALREIERQDRLWQWTVAQSHVILQQGGENAQAVQESINSSLEDPDILAGEERLQALHDAALGGHMTAVVQSETE